MKGLEKCESNEKKKKWKIVINRLKKATQRERIKREKKKKSGKEIVKLAFLEIKRTNIVEARTDKRESNTTHFRR